MKTMLVIKGTHCPACKALIEDVATEIPGLISCQVNYQTGHTEIEHQPPFSLLQFQNEVQKLGNYEVVEAAAP